MAIKTLLALTAAKVATAHFGLEFPEWRADTLSADANSDFDQWRYPCANVPFGEGNVTEWNGKAVTLELHHPYSYVWLNVGLGNDTTEFNITLTPQFWNVTGNDTVCVDKLPFPDDIADGTIGTLQVVTSDHGPALYNCADFKYSKKAKGPSKCEVPEGIQVIPIKSQSNDTSSEGEDHEEHHHGGDGEGKNMDEAKDKGGESEESSEGDKDKGAAGMLSLNKVTLTALVGVGFAATMLGL